MFIQEHFSVLRRLTYPDADVFIICFSIIDPYSFKRVQTKWVKELSEYCPNTPVVLVGTKYDQRNNINTKILLNKHGLQPVSSEQGEQVARKIGAKQVNLAKINFEKNYIAILRDKNLAVSCRATPARAFSPCAFSLVLARPWTTNPHLEKNIVLKGP